MQYILTEREMRNFVQRNELEMMKIARDALFAICQPDDCIHKRNDDYVYCDECKFSALRLIEKGGLLEKEGYETAVKVCPLAQSYSK